MAEKHNIQCYWNAEDRECGYSDINELIESHTAWPVPAKATVFEVEHVAVIRTTFEAQMVAAEDSDSDDDLTFSFPTREECEAAVDAEFERRKALEETT